MSSTPHPARLFDPRTRNMMAVAHQDDEIMYCGLITRLSAETDFLWLTNGDGLAPEEKAVPAEYAALRKAEADQVLQTLGRPLERRRCLDYSEIEIYDHFVEFTLNPARAPELLDYFHGLGCAVYRELKRVQPDVVWTAAFQNGHPEHDLTHILAAYAIRQLSRETGRTIALYQMPEYEYTILIPMRFHPLYRGVVHEIALTDAEIDKKIEALRCYPSQEKLFARFEKVLNGLGKGLRLIGKGFDIRAFLGKEVFGPVPADTDYTRSTHWFEWANYMRDYNKNVKVRFDTQIAAIARGLLGREFR